MKKIVFTIKDDVCLANGKDVNATELIAIMGHYGTVEDYDKHMAKTQSEYQVTLNNMISQFNAIKDQELTADEIEIVKSYRESKASVVVEYESKVSALMSQLQTVKEESKKRYEQIKAIIGEDAEE